MVPPITRVSSFRLRRKDVAAAETVAHICDNTKALVMFILWWSMLLSASFAELWPNVISRTHMYLYDKRYTAEGRWHRHVKLNCLNSFMTLRGSIHMGARLSKYLSANTFSYAQPPLGTPSQVVITANFWANADQGSHAPFHEFIAMRGFPTVAFDMYSFFPFGESSLDVVHCSWNFHGRCRDQKSSKC